MQAPSQSTNNVCRDIDKAVKWYGLEGWWRWWKPRGFHLVPALRGFNLPRSNYAESGQSKLKGDRKISLIESVIEDCMEFLVQASDYRNFINNSEVVWGRGPSQFEHEERERKRREEICRVSGTSYKIRGPPEVSQMVDSEPRFCSWWRARHKAPKDSRTGVQGNVRWKQMPPKKEHLMVEQTVPKTIREEKKEKVRSHKENKPDRWGHGHNPRYDSNDEGFDDSYIERIFPEDYTEVPENVERRQIEDLQKVEYFAIRKGNKTCNVSICQGCVRGFKDLKYFRSPMNLVFRYKCTGRGQTRTKSGCSVL